jgi:hypothetical protein
MRWSKQFVGQIDAQSAGDGGLLLTDLVSGTAIKAAAGTGRTLWQRGPEGAYRLWPSVLSDVDGRGSPDVAFALLNSYVIVSGEDGRELLTLGADDRPYGLGDVTGDGCSDLAVVTGADSATPTVRLIRGRALATAWTQIVPFGDHASVLALTGRGGLGGTVLLHAVSGPTVALAGATGRRLWSVAAPN